MSVAMRGTIQRHPPIATYNAPYPVTRVTMLAEAK